MSKDAAKARPEPRHCTGAPSLTQRAAPMSVLCCPLKVWCKNIAPLMCDECCATSFCAEVQRSHHRRCELVGRAQRRSFCLRCTWLVPQASIPAAGGVCTHAMLAHHTVLTCVLTSCARRRWKGSGAHIQWISMIGHVVARCSWWWCMPWCNGLLRFAACGDRDRSQDRPLTSRV